MAKNEETAVIVKNVSKSFKIPLDKSSGIKQLIVNFYKRRKGYREFKALDDISLEVKKGEFFGIVGRNGSGKSTLLKILAGVYSPDSGGVAVNGSLTPFIELGVGFNPELTGRENVFLNGALLGFSKKETEAMYSSIVDFAELHDFMEERLKNYSSGMQVRLAFSIAIRAETDILVLDEVLAVGDEAFQRKCFSYFAELKRKKKTVILVTHSMDSIQQFCTSAILIDKGHKTETGSPSEIAQIYRDLNKAEDTHVEKRKDATVNKYIKASVKLIRKNGKLNAHIAVSPERELEDPIMSFAIYKDSGEQLYRWVSDEVDLGGTDLNKKLVLNLEIQDIFPTGEFYASIFMKNRMRTVDYADFVRIAQFKKDPPRGASIYDKFWKPEETFSIRNVD